MDTLNRLLGGAVTDALMLATVTAALVGLVGIAVLRRRARDVDAVDVLQGLFIVALVVLLSVTLMPGYRGMVPMINLVPGHTIAEQLTGIPGRIGAANILGNVLLFIVPAALVRLGFGLSARMTILAGFALSVVIEFLQLALHLGRSTDIDDVILNTLGTAIGVLVAAAAARRVHNSSAFSAANCRHR